MQISKPRSRNVISLISIQCDNTISVTNTPEDFVATIFDWFDLIWFFQQYFSYIMATSFSGGRSRSTWREPPTMGKQLVSFITCGCESSSPFFAIYKAGREPTPYWW